MKKITLVAGLALALVLPTVAGAKPSPDNGDRRAAQKECRTLRGGTDATGEAFLTRFRNFGACVRRKAVEEAQEEQTAHKNASKECKAEREADPEAFAQTYGTENSNRRNAFGKCVSQKARENEAEADEQDQQNATEFKNAAKECAAEREADPEAFAQEYGTESSNRKNAFGKCVSRKVRENEQAPAA
jgi:hypothetical protein